MLAQAVLVLGGVYVLLERRGHRFESMGLVPLKRRDFPRALLIVLASFAVNVVLTLVIVASSPGTLEEHLAGLESVALGLTTDAPLVATIALLLLVGFYEEIVARGLLLTRLRGSNGVTSFAALAARVSSEPAAFPDTRSLSRAAGEQCQEERRSDRRRQILALRLHRELPAFRFVQELRRRKWRFGDRIMPKYGRALRTACASGWEGRCGGVRPKRSTRRRRLCPMFRKREGRERVNSTGTIDRALNTTKMARDAGSEDDRRSLHAPDSATSSLRCLRRDRARPCCLDRRRRRDGLAFGRSSGSRGRC